MTYSNFRFRRQAPLELFGYHVDDPRLIEQRKTLLCPFTNSKCTKKLYRTTNNPTGSCSVTYQGQNVMICPNRFCENNNSIIISIAQKFLKTTDIILVPEVKVPDDFGKVDYIGMVLKNGRKIKDFVPIEIQTNQTTQTGPLTDAIKEHERTGTLSLDRYGFGLNTYHQIKTSFTQCLNKSQCFKEWGRKYVWLYDESVFSNLTERFSIEFHREDPDDDVFFYSYRLEMDRNTGYLTPKLKSSLSSSREHLLDAYLQEKIPEERHFIETLLNKYERSQTLNKNNTKENQTTLDI